MATQTPRRRHRPDGHARRPLRSPFHRGPGGPVLRYIGIAVALICALFPIVFIFSAALNPAGTLTRRR